MTVVGPEGEYTYSVVKLGFSQMNPSLDPLGTIPVTAGLLASGARGLPLQTGGRNRLIP